MLLATGACGHLSPTTHSEWGMRVGPDFAPSSLANDYIAFYRDSILNRQYLDWPNALTGASWPPGGNAVSMAGQRKADNAIAAVAQAVADGVPGHVIETGVWRGGLSFLMAKTLEVLGQTSRLMYLADSFQGIPPPPKGTGVRYSAQDASAWKRFRILNNNSVHWVQRDAVRFHLNEEQLRWVVGFFSKSLPELVQREPDLQFAVVRLDGDAYFSTMDALNVLYPRLQPGGFLILDDFTEWTGCRNAVHVYRRDNNITEPITLVPQPYPELNGGAYWRKQSTAPGWRELPTCVGPGKGITRDLRATGSFLPTRLTRTVADQVQPGNAQRVVNLPRTHGPEILSLSEPTGLYRCSDNVDALERRRFG
jgi:O-methyltransferase